MNKHQDLSNPNSLRSRIRAKRVKHLVNTIRGIIDKEKLNLIKIADIGGSYRYWLVFPFEEFESVNFEITLINLEESKFFEPFNVKNATFISKLGNGCNLDVIEDKAYHLSHSNSVIEHVGNWQNIKKFRNEQLRIGKYHFIQTPNYWFPIEPHYFLPLVHLFPRPICTKLLMIFKKKNFDTATSNFEDNRMLSKKEFKYLFPNSNHITERFYFLPKSFIATSRIE